MKPIRLLYTIPNFKTAGSQNVLLSVLRGLNPKYFHVFIAVENYPELIPNDIPVANQIHITYKGIFREDLNQFSKILKKFKIEVCHSWDYKSNLIEASASRICGVKYLYTKKNNAWSKRWWLKSVLASHIAYDNPKMEARFFSPFYLKSKTSFIPHGVDVNRFKPRKKMQTKVVNLCCIGNIVPNKNQAQIITTLSKFPNHVHLNLFGEEDKAYRRQLDNLLEKYNLESRVSFHGFIQYEDMPKVLSEQHIFISASFQEGLPVSVLEAQACGLPVICSDSGGGTAYILKDDKGGFLYHSLSDLEDRIQRLLNDKELYLRKSEEAVSNISERFSLEKEINAYKNLYLSLTN